MENVWEKQLPPIRYLGREKTRPPLGIRLNRKPGTNQLVSNQIQFQNPASINSNKSILIYIIGELRLG